MKIPGLDFLVIQAVRRLHAFGRIRTAQSLQEIRPESVKSILITVTTALGDSITFTPALEPLRRRFPRARIVGLYHHAFADLYTNDPRFDRIIPYYGKYKRVRETVRDLKRESCDLALLPYMNDPDVIPLVLLGGTRMLFRMPGRNTVYSFCVMNPELLLSVPPGDHANKRATDMVAHLGCGIASLDSSIHVVSEAEMRTSRRFEAIQSRARQKVRIWIGFHPGASIPQKRWPPGQFRALATHILSAYPDAHILLTGSAQERDLCEQIRGGDQESRITNLAGDVPILEMPALLKQTTVFISGDTGIAVMAYALGCRTVTLFWSTDPSRSGPRIAGDLHRVVQAPSADAISPDRVLSEVSEQIRSAGIHVATPDTRLSKSDIARGYDALPENKFMPSKYHRFCLRLAGGIEGRVLDLGCGPGRMTDVLGSSGLNIRLFASDLSFQQCRTTSQKPCHSLVCQSDAERLPFHDNAFDAVFMIEVLDHLYEPVKAIREVRRVLKPGGRLIVSVPNRDWMRYDSYMRGRKPFQPVDDHWFRASEIQALLTDTGFQIRIIRGGENLYFGGGIPHALEKIAVFLYSILETRMKRLILISVNGKAAR